MTPAKGQWVSVRPDAATDGGMHGSVAMVFANGMTTLEVYEPFTHFLTFDVAELTDPTIAREAYLRQCATLRLAHAEAAVVEARSGLRAAVKAEIAAMPAVPRSDTFHDMVAALWPTLGGGHDMPSGIIWEIGAASIMLYRGESDRLILLVTHDDANLSWGVDGPDATALDTALKAALCWLADRDVFLPARSS